MDKQKHIEDMAHNLCLKERDCEDCERNGVCLAYSTATIIYNAGYRKIPEGLVVLTKEEYVVLKIKKKEKHWLEGCMAVWKKVEIETRKETAKEIFCKLLKEFSKRKSCGNADVVVMELANQYGVEVEE